jgi:hypothetical protein
VLADGRRRGASDDDDVGHRGSVRAEGVEA